MASALITASELIPLIGQDNVRVVDASWHMPAANRRARDEYLEAHIPSAGFFDLDENSDQSSVYPHMLPGTSQFAQAMGSLGITNDTRVIVYDATGLFSASRLWWMLRIYGHDKVRVLDGGLSAWRKAGGGIEVGPKEHSTCDFYAKFDSKLLVKREQIECWSVSGSIQVCDARSAARFRGEEPEPRAGVRSGHIPMSLNIPYASLLTAENRMKPRDELRSLFEAAGVDFAQPLATSCGSGVTACILALALYELGCPHVPVYDGSWAEWGSSDLPIAVGA